MNYYILKKIVKYFIVYTIFIFFQGCASVSEVDFIESDKRRALIGYYIYGHEVNSFQPCGQEKLYWVHGSNNILKTMEMMYIRHIDNPYDEVFVEIIGVFTDTPRDGFSLDYDGQINILKIISMNKKYEVGCESIIEI